MEFEELKKVWDKQNGQTLYVINESVLHKKVVQGYHKANKLSTINEIGLIIISLITSSILIGMAIYKENGGMNYLIAFAMIAIGIFVWKKRRDRIKSLQVFDTDILGKLGMSIANTNYLIRIARSFVWWYILPLATLVSINLAYRSASLEKWILIYSAFVLSFVVVRWEMNRVQIPKLKRLEELKRKLKEEPDSD